jgi:hypothetical protein
MALHRAMLADPVGVPIEMVSVLDRALVLQGGEVLPIGMLLVHLED